jgi:hypothetical protein
MAFTLVWVLVIAIPNLLLAVGGWLLWRRHHSAATLLIGAGVHCGSAGASNQSI